MSHKCPSYVLGHLHNLSYITSLYYQLIYGIINKYENPWYRN